MLQNPRAFSWSRLYHLPDSQSLPFANRLALVAVSQWPLIALLRWKQGSPLARLLRCSHTRLFRYGGVLGAVQWLLLLLHVLKQLAAVDTDLLLSDWGQKRKLAYGVLYLALVVVTRNAARRSLWVLVALTPLALSLYVVWGHAPAARVYLLQTLGVFLGALVLQTKTTAFSVPQPSSETQAAADAAVKPAEEGQEPRPPPMIIIRSERRKGDNKAESEDDGTGNKRLVVAVVCTTQSWLLRLISGLWETGSLAFGLREARASAHNESENQTISMEYASAPMSASHTEEARVTVHFEGPNPLARDIDELVNFDADHVVFIAGGLAGFLAYPSVFSYAAAQGPNLASHPPRSVRVVWMENAASGAGCAVPSRLPPADGGAAADATTDKDAVVLCPDTELEHAATAATSQRRRVRQSCQLSGTCAHAGLRDVVDELMRGCKSSESVAVVVLGPKELEREARWAVRPWVMDGRRVWWLYEYFSMQ